MCRNLNPLQGLTLESPRWWNEDLCTESRTENGCWRHCEIMTILYLMLATVRNQTGASSPGSRRLNHHASHHWWPQKYCYFIYASIHWECRKVWAPKLMIKMEEKTKQKQGWERSGWYNENGMECGKCKDKKRCCGEVKNSKIAAWCNGRRASRDDC